MSIVEFGERLDGINYESRPGAYGIGFRKISQVFDGHEKKQLIQVGVVHTPRGRFLPGGGIEEEENHQEAIKREFVEEIGHDVEVIQFVIQANQSGLTPRTHRYVILQGHFYLVEIKEHIGGQVEEDHELIWIEVEEALRTLRLMNQSHAVMEAFKVYMCL